MIKNITSMFSSLFGLATGNRYVSKFIPVNQDLPQANSTIENRDQQKILDSLLNAIKSIKKITNKYPQINELNEKLYIDVVDIPQLYFTVEIANGDALVDVGIDSSIQPDFYLPLISKNILNLEVIAEDGEIDLSESYRIIRTLLIPFLRGLYQADYSHLPEDKSYMQLDNFIQIEIQNPENIEVDGFPGPARATAVNVDHQWLIFNEWQGDPDIRYSMSVKDALMFAYLIRVKLIKGKPNLNELQEIIKQYNELKKKVTVYERSWH